jgi:chemotaxis protein MotB
LTQAQPQADIRSNQQTETQSKPAPDVPNTQDVKPALDKVEKNEQGAIPLQDILRLSKNLVTEANLDDIDVVLTDNQSIKVSVRGNLLFDLGKADLKPEAISFLRDLSKIIAANNYQIEVAGHTDNFPVSNPAYPTNWELSAARAARVARYLIQYGNLEPGRFTVIGHSFYQPTVANDSLANKAKNRRVEIIITRYTFNPAGGNP